MKTALYKPNDYLFKATERYLDISLYSSGYFFTTDTVPFLQTVLKGISLTTLRLVILMRTEQTTF